MTGFTWASDRSRSCLASQPPSELMCHTGRLSWCALYDPLGLKVVSLSFINPKPWTRVLSGVLGPMSFPWIRALPCLSQSTEEQKAALLAQQVMQINASKLVDAVIWHAPLHRMLGGPDTCEISTASLRNDLRSCRML